MERFVRITGILLAVTLFGLTLSHAQESKDGVELQIGAGARSTPSEVNALFKIEIGTNFNLQNDSSGYVRFVVAKIKVDMSGNSSKIQEVDLDFKTVSYEQSMEDITSRFSWGLSLLNVDYQRNLVIDNNETMRISLVGFDAEYAGEISDNFKIIIKGAVDLVGLAAVSQRQSDGSETKSNGASSSYGAKGEITLEFHEKYKVTFGGKLSHIGTNPETTYEGYGCQTYYYNDPYYGYGHGYTYCGDIYSERFTQQRNVSSLYVDLVASLARNFKAFGQAAYNVYRVNDDLGIIPNSKKSAMQFKLGVLYKL